jgi:predicted transcriptional regulator YdeE
VKGDAWTMGKTHKRLILIFVLISALILPTSAYAAKSTAAKETKKSSFQINQIWSSLFGKKNSNEKSNDYFEKEKERESQKDRDGKSHKNKESADIWENWYCY